ncbi:MAG: cupin domain-containing protein [Candidatus Promineifilaceae bacterium]|nr:cupin domain-containing protein [Candidatus Promineifilaceae bacterium]
MGERGAGAQAALYPFEGVSGYLVHPRQSRAGAPVALGHTAAAEPWQDGDVHLHREASEIFILLQGRLRFLVGDSVLSLRPAELLLVRPGIPHAIVGGAGLIEHFGLRTPAVDDRESLYSRPIAQPTLTHEEAREVSGEWGHRIPLSDGRNQNVWLLGRGVARFPCDYLALAYGRFRSTAAAALPFAPEELHRHTRCWEYYVVLRGTVTLQVDDHVQTAQAGSLLEVPPGVCHAIADHGVPFAGLTIRAPLVHADRVECESVRPAA